MIVFVFIISLLLVGTAFAQGTSIETAELIVPGEYSGSGLQDGDPPQFYKINVKPGQTLMTEVEFFKSKGSPDEFLIEGILSIYNEDKVEIIKSFGDQVEQESFSPNSGNIFFIKLNGLRDWEFVHAYSLKVSFVDTYDAGLQTDAGDSFGNALDINPGVYPSNWLSLSKVAGSDQKDIFKISIKKNEKISVKVTPNSESSISLKIYDDSRQLATSELTQNLGAITKTSYLSFKDQEAYIEVLSESSFFEKLSFEDIGKKYALEVIVESVPEEDVKILSSRYGNENGIKWDFSQAELDSLKQEAELLENYNPFGLNSNDNPEELQNALEDLEDDPDNVQKQLKVAEALANLGQDASDNDIRGLGNLETAAATGFFAIGGIIILIYAVIIIGSLILFIVAAISIFTSKNEQSWKILWIVVVFFGGFVGAIIYFIIGKKSRITSETDRGISNQPQEESPSNDPRIQQLKTYVNQAIKSGKSKEIIRAELLKSGWPENLVNQVL